MKYNRQREAGGIQEALGIVRDARGQASKGRRRRFSRPPRYHSAESRIMAAEFTYRAALIRKESRSTHFREGFPERDDKNWFKWITIEKKDVRPHLSTLSVSLEVTATNSDERPAFIMSLVNMGINLPSMKRLF
jgi:succinate dehydrogenase/fumarate reductase flavoprotein subunit